MFRFMPSVKDKRKTLRDFPEGPRPLAVGALETSLPCGSFSLIQPPFGGRYRSRERQRGIGRRIRAAGGTPHLCAHQRQV
jgi:hypothetical protein